MADLGNTSSFGSGATTPGQETEQNAALGNCTSVNTAVAADQSVLNQGQLAVLPAYYQTAAETTQALTSASHMIGSRFVSPIRFSISKIARRIAAVTGAGTGTIKIHADNAGKPGTVLATLGTLGSGAAAGWAILTVTTPYDILPGKYYWITETGEAAKNYSVGIASVTAVCGSAHPDGMISSYSTDGGSTWTACTQNGLPALWNCIINPADPAGDGTNPIPQLYYGATLAGNRVFIPGTGIVSIPDAGIAINLHGHGSPDANFGYHVWLNYSSGLVLTATTDARDITNGSVHKVGATSFRWLGDCTPIECQSGQYGPVDVRSRRLLTWPGRRATIGKPNPYHDASPTETVLGTSWVSWQSNGDIWKIELQTCDPITDIALEASLRFSTAGNYAVPSIGIDGKLPSRMASSSQSITGQTQMRTKLVDAVGPGRHYAYPLFRGVGATFGVQYHGAAADLPEAFFGGRLG